MMAIKTRVKELLEQQTSILPLVVFRIAFGLMMAGSAIRFWAKGWIEPLYIQPEFHFTFYYFEWLQALPGKGMYFIFAALILLSLSIAAGFFYRFSALLYFLLFTYVELIDKALYLNHYYFISLISFLMIFMPANRLFSIDSLLKKELKCSHIPAIFPNIIKCQLALVYIFAGIAKVNSEWLIEAMPLKLWLPARANLPFIGSILDYEWTPYLMSWSGMLYDLTIPLFLIIRKTRLLAYLTVVIFHIMTWYLFQIGMFPWIMIVSTLIFFDHQDFLFLKRLFSKKDAEAIIDRHYNPTRLGILKVLAGLYLTVQVLIPLRHLIYQGDANWTEEGFRYSWNVMRVEKTGYLEYHCIETATRREWTVYPSEELSAIQAKQMAFQPDMILQYAHRIRDRHPAEIEVYAITYVSLNGRPSKPFTQADVNLSKERESLFRGYRFIERK